MKGLGAGVWMMLCRLARGGLLALAPAVLPACYHYVEVASEPGPQVGAKVEIELNDVGRVRMESAIGPEAGRIQGSLESRSDTGLVVRVGQVLGEYGGVTRWEGERVAIRPEYVRTMGERQFSMTRTVVAATVASAGLVVFVVTRNLLGLGGAPSSTDSGNNGKSQ